MPSSGEPRPWEWIFSSLWTACGRENQGCRLNVPQTVLFKHGEPRKWIATSASGHVTRRSFGRPPPGARGADRALHRMRVVHAALSEAAEAAGLGAGDPAAVAWYADTGKEEIDLETLHMCDGPELATLLLRGGPKGQANPHRGRNNLGKTAYEVQEPAIRTAIDKYR